MITFNYTSLANQTLSSNEVSEFVFNAKNHGETTRIVSHTVSCGCTSVLYPSVIESNSNFSVKVKIDKRNQSGYTSQSIYLKFSNGKDVTLYVSGKVV